MNRRQVFVVLFVIAVIALFVLVPPYQQATFRDAGLTRVLFIGYAPLVNPPEIDGIVRLDYGRLLLQIGTACIVGLGLYQVVGDRE